MTDSKTPEWAREEALEALKAARPAYDSGEQYDAHLASISQALLSAYERGRAEREWQDISTAPKDGTVVDLWHREFGRHPDCYWGLPSHECGEAGQYCDSDWHGASEGWVDSTFNEFSFEQEGFTHWAPIPAPPAIRQLLEVKG